MKQILVILIVAVTFGCTPTPKVEETVDKERANLTTLVMESMIEIQRKDREHVHFKAEQLFVSERATSGNPREFDLAVGQVFFHPDHHYRIVFTVREIDDSIVVLDYESVFSHESFGKNLITKDRGTINVPYKQPVAAHQSAPADSSPTARPPALIFIR
ncbi:hypothetical protein [Chitinolyticbacter albus]|uniref:hypothetical protein n=1 Tax=Chitinolyticbacter albus TaxID=2961951 RepID=UPI00210E96E7|nr:hypothetical protein [Chitinolyticbacter albus]